jgi:hypothetical protein
MVIGLISVIMYQFLWIRSKTILQLAKIRIIKMPNKNFARYLTANDSRRKNFEMLKYPPFRLLPIANSQSKSLPSFLNRRLL